MHRPSFIGTAFIVTGCSIRLLLHQPRKPRFELGNILRAGAINVLLAKCLVPVRGDVAHSGNGPPRNFAMRVLPFRSQVFDKPLATPISKRIFSQICRSRSFIAHEPPFQGESCCSRAAARESGQREAQAHPPGRISARSASPAKPRARQIPQANPNRCSPSLAPRHKSQNADRPQMIDGLQSVDRSANLLLRRHAPTSLPIV